MKKKINSPDSNKNHFFNTRFKNKWLASYGAILCLLLLVSCSSSKPELKKIELNETERKLLGAWQIELARSDNGSQNFSYFELYENKTGFKGHTNGKGSDFNLVSFFDRKIRSWKVTGDSLEIVFINPSLTLDIPDIGRKSTKESAITEHWVIEEIHDEYFIGEWHSHLFPPNPPAIVRKTNPMSKSK